MGKRLEEMNELKILLNHTAKTPIQYLTIRNKGFDLIQ